MTVDRNILPVISRFMYFVFPFRFKSLPSKFIAQVVIFCRSLFPGIISFQNLSELFMVFFLHSYMSHAAETCSKNGQTNNVLTTRQILDLSSRCFSPWCLVRRDGVKYTLPTTKHSFLDGQIQTRQFSNYQIQYTTIFRLSNTF